MHNGGILLISTSSNTDTNINTTNIVRMREGLTVSESESDSDVNECRELLHDLISTHRHTLQRASHVPHWHHRTISFFYYSRLIDAALAIHNLQSPSILTPPVLKQTKTHINNDHTNKSTIHFHSHTHTHNVTQGQKQT
jgi:hypothetical protein